MQYGDRCRVTSQKREWFQIPPHQPESLVPQKLLSKEGARKVNMISGPEISTPRASSRKKLLRELLQIVEELSDANWGEKDDLDISLRSLEGSSSDMDSSSDSSSSYENITPPQTPPLGGVQPLPEFKYVNFSK
nr:ORF3 [Torque teno felis virus]